MRLGCASCRVPKYRGEHKALTVARNLANPFLIHYATPGGKELLVLRRLSDASIPQRKYLPT